jgi:hypothetical protein
MRPGARRCRQKLIHPRIVIGPIEDNDLRRTDLADDRRRCLEQMRILIGIAHYGDDVDQIAANLPSDVSIEIFRRDDAQLGLLCRRTKRHG